jgi:hypothetical protein
MTVFDLARQRATHVRETTGDETVARLVHSATLGNSMPSMIDGAVHDGHMTRGEGRMYLALARQQMQDFERNSALTDHRK